MGMFLTWHKPAIKFTTEVLEATDAARGGLVEFHIEERDGEIRPSFLVIHPTLGVHSSEDTESWPIIERFVPRKQWPVEMYAGKVKDRNPDPEILAAIEEYKRTMR